MKILVAEIYDGYNQDSTYVLVYKNPQSEEINSLGNYFRGIIDEAGNLYAWNKSVDFLHDAAKQQFNIPNGLDIIVSSAGMVIINNNYTMGQLISMMKNARTNLSFLSDSTQIKIQNNNKNDFKWISVEDLATLEDIYQLDKTRVAKVKTRLRKLAKQ